MPLIGYLILLIALGFLAWWVGQSPIIDPPVRAAIKWLILGIAVLVILYAVWIYFPTFNFPHRRG